MEYLQSIRAVPAKYFGITLYQNWVNWEGYFGIPQVPRYYITKTLRLFYDLQNVLKKQYERTTPRKGLRFCGSKPAVCQFVKRFCDSSRSGSEVG